MPRLIVEAAADPELFAVCRAVLVDPRRAALRCAAHGPAAGDRAR